MLLPHVKAINDEQIAEKETKAKILGLEFEEVNPQAVDCFSADRLYCDICKTSYSSDICLACCLEIRNGKLQACQEDVSWNYINRGLEYVHGEKGEVVETTNNKLNSEDRMKLISMWKAKEAGSISCYCGAGELELKRILPNDWLSDLFKKVEKAAEANKLSILPKMAMKQCPCFNSQGHIDNANYKRLKAACREGAEDNYLYSPSVRDVQQDDLKHFQHHWVKGEPVVMRNVLEVTPGLSWEPMVMWRIYRQLATPSMDYVEKLMLLIVWTSVRDQFILMNSESFKENLPRHWKEFLCSLPLKQYSHPGCGPLNLAVKLLEAKHGAKDVHCLLI